jgi:hypothetical protein
MLPGAPFAVLVLLALMPGWLFFRLAERRGPRPERSQLAELLEFAAVGFTAITVASLLVIALSLKFNHWFFDLRAWANRRHQYVSHHIGAALFSITFIIVLSLLITLGLFLLFYGRKAADFQPGINVWDAGLGAAPKGMQNWLGVHRKDGSLIEGLLLCHPAGANEDSRELALTKPIRLTPPGGNPANLEIDRVVIPGEEIAAIVVVHVPKPGR